MKTDLEILYEKVDNVINKFDFEKVHAYMVLTNWKWRGDKVPTVENLKDTAHQQMYYAIAQYQKNTKQSTETGTGGFYCTIFVWEGKPFVKLSFQPFRSSSY